MAKMRELLVRARRHEQAGDLARAIEAYRQALSLQEETDGVADLGLYNRLGDLHLRAGDVRSATAAFERAASQYEAQQLYSNAIALCKKILRNAPGETDVHRRVGRLTALSGLSAEARLHYATFADRREEEGDAEAAAEAFLELVRLQPDEETRLAAADRLRRIDRFDEAVEQLQLVWRARRKGGGDAEEVRRRILAIDPAADPLTAAERGSRGPEEGDGSGQVSRAEGGDAGRSDTAAHAPAASNEGAPDNLATNSPNVLADADERETVTAAGAASRIGTDVESLATELQEVLGALEGEERMRQALPILDQLVRLQPDRVDLLQRKLSYALELGEEEATVTAFLGLGACLERRLDGFSLRFLSSSSAGGGVTTAVMLGGRPVAGASE